MEGLPLRLALEMFHEIPNVTAYQSRFASLAVNESNNHSGSLWLEFVGELVANVASEFVSAVLSSLLEVLTGF